MLHMVVVCPTTEQSIHKPSGGYSLFRATVRLPGMTEHAHDEPMLLPLGFVTDWALAELEKRNAEQVEAGTLTKAHAQLMSVSAEGAFNYLLAFMKEHDYQFIGPSLAEVEAKLKARGDHDD